MKYFFSIAFSFILLQSIAQKNQKGYFSLRGGISLKEGTNKAIGRVSVGVSNNDIFGFGGGFGIIQYEKPYLPLTFDISFFGKPGKISPCIIGNAGYGIYNYNVSGLTMRGGFTGGLSGGISFPGKDKFKTFVLIGVSTYHFTTYIQNKTIGSSETRLEISAGFKI